MTPAAPAQERVIAVWDAIDASFDGYLDELEELCRFRSRREEPDGMLATKEWIERRLRALGASIEVVESARAYPYLLARVGTGERSLLNFNHYDVEVEPPGPDEAWTTPPYEPARRDGRMFARGIADDKAALLSRIHVVDAFVKAGVELPVEVRFLIEGSAHSAPRPSRRWSTASRTSSAPTVPSGRTPGATSTEGRCSSWGRRGSSTSSSGAGRSTATSARRTRSCSRRRPRA
ncbi:M20/M25/M40 family metallo-hydrolase [Pseudonocardia benzenivorans]